MFITIRILHGCGLGMLICLVPLYLTEVSPPHCRGIMTGLTVIGFGIGYIAYALVPPDGLSKKKKVLTSVQRGVGVGRDTLCKEPDDAMEVTTGTIVRWSPRPPHGRVVCAW
jgi:hypothetical protein